MRKMLMLVTVAPLALGLAACGSSSSSSDSTTTKAPSSSGGADKLSGKVNDKGTKSVTGKSDAELEVEADDFYFKPTYIKASPGQKVKVELHNEGSTTHTFTSSKLGVDEELAPDAKKTITVTVPDTAGLADFHCNFHSSMGMRGAFVVG